MTKPELFGLPKWLTEKEEELLAAGYRDTFDIAMTADDFTVSSSAVVNEETTAVRVVAESQSRYFGLAGPHYFPRRSFDEYFNTKPGAPPKPPYLLFQGDAPYEVVDILAELKATYGLELSFSDVAYAFGDRIQDALSWPVRLQVRDSSFRYRKGSIPVYANPTGLEPLVRLVNPGRYIPGLMSLFQDVEYASASELQYFNANATAAHEYLATLSTGMIFEEESDVWEFGNDYLIPLRSGEARGWVCKPELRFQNVYGAKVRYNGKLRVSDVLPVNRKLTHTLVLELDPEYSYRATGLLRVFYTIPNWTIPLSSVILQTVLNGLNYMVPDQDLPLSSILRVTQLNGLYYQP